MEEVICKHNYQSNNEYYPYSTYTGIFEYIRMFEYSNSKRKISASNTPTKLGRFHNTCDFKYTISVTPSKFLNVFLKNATKIIKGRK